MGCLNGTAKLLNENLSVKAFMLNKELSVETSIINKAFIVDTSIVCSTDAKPILPYDAEVEYLESSGTQYIDTGINPRGGVTFDMKVSATAKDTNNTNIFIGNYFYSVSTPRHMLNISGVGKWNVNGGTLTGDATKGSTAKYGRIYQLHFVVSSVSKDDTYKLFANITDRDAYSSFVRIYSMQITKAGELVRDFIPVRVGQVGYLYDKVDEELFGNSGTDDFILGPDK